MSIVYTKALELMATGDLDFETATIKAMLVTSAYSEDPDEEVLTNAAAAEISATNYTGGHAGAGRKTIANPSVAKSDANNNVVFDCDDLNWTSLGGASNATIAAVVLFEEKASDAASIPICKLDLSSPVTTDGNNFDLTIAAGGLFTIDV